MVVTVCLLTLGFVWAGMAAISPAQPCDRDMFDTYINVCLSEFNSSMELSSYRDSCPWPSVKGLFVTIVAAHVYGEHERKSAYQKFSKSIFAGFLTGSLHNSCFHFIACVYNQLKKCVDHWAMLSSCRGRGFLVDDVFLAVHRIYFSLCGQVQDPPFIIVTMLFAPCVIATLLAPILCTHLNKGESI